MGLLRSTEEEVSRRGVDDKLIWNFSKDGKFSVRSAYYVAIIKEEERWESLQALTNQ